MPWWRWAGPSSNRLNNLAGQRHLPLIRKFTPLLIGMLLTGLTGRGEPEAFYRLFVSKAELVAELRVATAYDALGQVVRRFRIATGQLPGDKQREGDLRTPEGIYFPRRHINTSSLSQVKFGTWAIDLNFPNLVDKMEGKTGFGIWLHGAGDDDRIDKENITEGCIAFYNQDINELLRWFPEDQGAIIIGQRLADLVDVEVHQEIRRKTLEWVDAWQNKRFEDYINFYAEDFRLGRLDLEGFGKYKQRLLNKYANIEINIDQLRVITHPKYVVAIMNLDYNAAGAYRSIGRKILYWQNNAERQNGADRPDNPLKKLVAGWEIIREDFSDTLIRGPVAVYAKSTAP